MSKVHWDWGLLASTAAGSGSHRVARRGTSAITQPATAIYSGDDDARQSGSGWSWTPSAAAQAPAALLSASGANFVFAFWWVQGGTTAGVPVGNSVVNVRGGFSVPVGGDGNASARAYYVWDFGGGGGPNAILIDAFDLATGFFPEDFVNVYPDDGRPHSDANSLYFRANDGYLSTDPPNADVTQQETLTAFDGSGRTFLYWLEVTALTYPTVNGPTVFGTDATVMPGSRLVSFAVYTTSPPSLRPRWHYEIYDPWWAIKTLGGLVPPIPPWGPPEPWVREYLAALTVSRAAMELSPKARAVALRAVLDQLASTASHVNQELQRTQ